MEKIRKAMFALMPYGSKSCMYEKMGKAFSLEKGVAKLTSRHLSKMQNGRHNQRSSQHTLACHKIK
jgi:hypothetical protein